MIEDDPQPAAEPTEPEAELETVEPRAKSPWKAFILTGVLAGLIGAAGGGYGAYAGLKKFAPAPVAQVDVDLSPLELKLKNLTERVSAAESDIKDAANRAAPEAETVDLSEIETRVGALESAPKPDIDPDALSSLQAAKKDGFEWPDVSALEARIAELEAKAESPAETAAPEDVMNRLTALETQLETLQSLEPTSSANDEIMSDLNARLTALENRPAPSPRVETVSILAFPKAQMVAAVDANMEGGMIKKTLSRHIRIKEANDPLTLIEGIELDIREGRLAAAAEKFERLPSPVRTAGQAWYESVKASL